jgi:hypothetical protein
VGSGAHRDCRSRRYEAIVTGAHVGISGFGGAFLMLVGLSFFFDADREHHWIGLIERPLAAFARLPLAPYIVTAFRAGALVLAAAGEQKTFLIAGWPASSPISRSRNSAI